MSTADSIERCNFQCEGGLLTLNRDWQDAKKSLSEIPFVYSENEFLRREITRIKGIFEEIRDFDYHSWKELSSADEFVEWAKRRANQALEGVA